LNGKEETKNSFQSTIQTICDTIGPRAPCSKKEAEGAKYILQNFKNFTDDAEIENFYCHPGSYRAAFRIPMINIILTTILYWIYFFYPNLILLVLSLIIIAVSVLVIQTNLMRNIEFIDPLFKKKESTNVYGRFKPKKEVKNIVVIGGHHDSNWEFTLLKKWPKFFTMIMGLPVILSYLLLGFYILKLILYIFGFPFLVYPAIDLSLILLQTALIPLLIYTIINCVSHTPVMGADDNLTSTAIILELAKYLNTLGGLGNTEVWLVSHGCEEIGDRGSKRFSKRHFNELKDAFVINVDMVGGKNSNLKIDIKELSKLVHLSKNIGEELDKIATDLDISHIIGNVTFFTDSMAYSQNNIEACSIVGAPKKGFATHYHTVEDTIDKLDFQNLWDCYRILIEFLKKVDKNEIHPKD
jgi:hypothetical protein